MDSVRDLEARAGSQQRSMEMDTDNPTTARFPVSHRQISLDVEGNQTDIIFSSYDDHILVIVTQIGSMGTMLHCRKEGIESIDPTFNVSVIFGKRDEPLLTACGRQLIEDISNSGYPTPLLLSLGLKDHSLETMKAVASAVINNKIW